MQALNTIIFSAGEPFAKYATTVKYSVTGKRLNPHDIKEQMTFILGDDEQNRGFDYEQHVIEIYSELENRYFIQTNKYLFTNGLIARYSDTIKEVSMQNVLTEEEVTAIASIPNATTLIAKLTEFTSNVAIDRIYARAEEIGRPKRVLLAIKSYKEGIE